MEQQSGRVEIWKTITWSPNYEVSNLGRVRRSHSAPKHGISIPGNIRKPVKRGGDYKYIDLPDKSGEIRRCRIGRLVLESFVGPPPSPLHQCNHKNNDKTDDHIGNLEWVTAKQNIKHSALLGMRRSKVTDKIVIYIRRIPYESYNRKQLAKQFGISPKTVTSIRRRRSWKHLE